MFNEIQRMSYDIGLRLRNLSTKKKNNFFVYEKSHRIVKFYAAIACFGPEIMNMEFEAIEIFLKKKGLSTTSVHDIAYVSYIVQNQDLCLINRHHYENAITILADIDVDISNTEYQTPGNLISGTMLLMSLIGAQNFPIESDALDFFVESIKEYGFVQPPLPVADVPKVIEKFDYFDESFINSFKNINIFDISNVNIENLPARIGNYLIKNIPIIEHIKETYNSVMVEAK